MKTIDDTATDMANHAALNSTSDATSDAALDAAIDTAIGAAAPSEAFDCDVVIVGAGPVGLALAGALARRSATAQWRVILVDGRDAAASQRDPRVLALSYGSRVLLTPLGWPTEATPIERIHVSQRGHFGRAIIERQEHDLPALGYVVRYGAIAASLRAGLETVIASGAPVELLERHHAQRVIQDDHGVTLTLTSTNAADARSAVAGNTAGNTAGSTARGTAGMSTAVSESALNETAVNTAVTSRTLRARLVIHAEGGLFSREVDTKNPTDPTKTLPAGSRSRDYRQTALVGTVRTSAPMPRVAWERFCKEGPIALLPIAESGAFPKSSPPSPSSTPAKASTMDYALVWCQSPEQAAARMRLSDADFLAALGETFGARVGQFMQIEGRAMFPLGLLSRDTLVDGRAAVIGNAAQTLHPVAGQGLNLGLRDAQALAAALGEHGPTPAALNAFSARRRLDRRMTIGMTDLLARGFTVDFAPLAILRGAALSALDLVPGAKSMLARQMMFGQRR